MIASLSLFDSHFNVVDDQYILGQFQVKSSRRMQIVSRVHTLVLCSLPTLNLWMVKEGRTGQGSQASVSRKIFNSSSRALGK